MRDKNCMDSINGMDGMDGISEINGKKTIRRKERKGGLEVTEFEVLQKAS